MLTTMSILRPIPVMKPRPLSGWLCLVLLPILAACSTPPRDCGTAEKRDLKVVEGLIGETRVTLERGYTRQTTDGSRINFCLGSRQSNLGISFCTDPAPQSRPVAIDTAAEQRKLDALLARRAALQMTLAEKTAACSGPS